MPATQSSPWTFIHRLDPYGTVESICPVCFQTIIQSDTEEDTARAEHTHACDPESVMELACFWNPAADR